MSECCKAEMEFIYTENGSYFLCDECFRVCESDVLWFNDINYLEE